MLEDGSSVTRKAPRTQNKNKSGELSTAPTLPLPLSLCLQRLSSRVASNVSDKRPSANPPREISALTSPMLCHAQFYSAEPPSSVALLPKRSLRSRGVKHSTSTPHCYTCHGHYTLSRRGSSEQGWRCSLPVYSMCIFKFLCLHDLPEAKELLSGWSALSAKP